MLMGVGFLEIMLKPPNYTKETKNGVFLFESFNFEGVTHWNLAAVGYRFLSVYEPSSPVEKWTK